MQSARVYLVETTVRTQLINITPSYLDDSVCALWKVTLYYSFEG